MTRKRNPQPACFRIRRSLTANDKKLTLCARRLQFKPKAVEKIVKAARGVQPADLYAAVNLDPSVLLDPDNRIPFAQLVALYEKAVELTGDNDFGLHLGQNINPAAFDVVGYCALNSPTLGAAFARVNRKS